MLFSGPSPTANFGGVGEGHLIFQVPFLVSGSEGAPFLQEINYEQLQLVICRQGSSERVNSKSPNGQDEPASSQQPQV